MSKNQERLILSRREFIKVGAGLGAAFLVSCAVPTAAPTNVPPAAPTNVPPTVPPVPSPTLAPTAVPAVELEKELNVLNWGSYIDFAIKPFQEKYNCKVNIEYYGSEDEGIAKVKASPGKYDTFNVGVSFLEVVAKQGLVQPLDVTRIASYQDMYPQFQPGPFGVDGKTYGICYAFGTNALMFNSELIPEGINTWEAFWDPKYKGKTALVDKAKDQWLSSMLRFGLDFKNPQEADFEKVKQSMKDKVKNMRTIWTSEDEVKRLMINKEIVLADSYDGLTAQITASYPAVKYQVPKEGTYGWYDGPELLAGAPHPNLAYKWIEFVTSPDMAKLVAEQVNYAPGNSKVPQMLTPELRTKLNLDDPQKALNGLKFPINIGTDWNRKITDAWTEAKTGA